MKLLRDLLFTRNNVALDIARLASLLSILSFWAGVLWMIHLKGDFAPLEVGGGCAAIMGGAAGWMHFRDKAPDEEKGD